MTGPAALEDLTWSDDALDMLKVWARSGLIFSADDLRVSFRPAPHGSMVGAAFSAAAKAGLICHVSTKESTTLSRKHSLIRTWVGVGRKYSMNKDDLTRAEKFMSRAENAARTNQPTHAMRCMTRALESLRGMK